MVVNNNRKKPIKKRLVEKLERIDALEKRLDQDKELLETAKKEYEQLELERIKTLLASHQMSIDDIESLIQKQPPAPTDTNVHEIHDANV